MSLATNIKGRLAVKVHQAKNFKKCDPYFKLVVDDLSAKSSQKNSCTEGVWNYELSVDLDGSQDNFELQLWDYDKWSKDDLVDTTGKMTLKSAIQQWNGKGTLWINMQNGSKVEITMKL